jgi:hypothetical protein
VSQSVTSAHWRRRTLPASQSGALPDLLSYKVVHMTNAHTDARARLIFDPVELDYDFGSGHPLQPRRLVALMDLLENSGLWHSGDERQCLSLRAASVGELGLVHTSDYIAAVQQLGTAEGHNESALAEQYGFAEGDTPALPGMHEVSAGIAGGTLVALSAVMGLPEGGTFNSEFDSFCDGIIMALGY